MSVKGQLDEKEVRRRLSLCADTAAGELFEFGERLVNYRIDISHRLDSKASALAGYGGAILAVLISSYASWKAVDRLAFAAIAFAGLTAFLGAACAVWAMALRRFVWFTQNEWLREECLEKPEITKGYRILTLWGILSSYEDICELKASRLRAAQITLLIAGFFLLAALFEITDFHAVSRYFLCVSRR